MSRRSPSWLWLALCVTFGVATIAPTAFTQEKKEEAKKEAKKEEPKKAAPKKEEPKKAEPKKEEKKADDKKPAPKKEEPKKDEKKPAPKKDDKKDDKKKADPDEAEATLKHRTVVVNLDNPSGLAFHAKTGHVFIASHDGIHRFLPKVNRCPLEVSGFSTDVYGKGPKYNIGPLGVALLDDEHIVVGDGSKPDGEELVRIYKFAAEHPGKYQKEADAVGTLGPIKAGEQSAKGEGNYYGVAVIDGTVFVTNNGDDTKGWISKAEKGEDGKWGALTPTIATKTATGVDAPVPIAVNTDGKLVVGQMGEMTVPGDSLLTIYDAKSGKLEAKGKTGLSDIAGLAYSAKTKKWYCTDFAWAKPEDGGLFELDVKPEGDGEVKDLKITAKKLMKLDKPTALAFDGDGNLYVATFGTKDDADSKMFPGSVIKIDAGELK